MTGKKSSPYDLACSRICFLAASSSGGNGARWCEAIGTALNHAEYLCERGGKPGEDGFIGEIILLGQRDVRTVIAIDVGGLPAGIEQPRGARAGLKPHLALGNGRLLTLTRREHFDR